MILICGLPGTGKTTLSKLIEKELGFKYVSDWQLDDNKLLDFVLSGKDEKIVLDIDMRHLDEESIMFFRRLNLEIYFLGYDEKDRQSLLEVFNSQKKVDELLQLSKKFKNICKENAFAFHIIEGDRAKIIEKLFKEIKENIMKVADKEELLKVLDENGNSTGRMEKRSIVHNDRLFHNEVALWVINGKDVLLQRRSKNKKLYPNKLALCAGHVVGDETLLEALYKEAREEIGIDLSKYEVKPIIALKREEEKNCCFSHHYYIKANIPINEFTIQEEELSEVLYRDFYWFKDNMKNGNDEISYKWSSEYAKLFEELEKIIEK